MDFASGDQKPALVDPLRGALPPRPFARLRRRVTRRPRRRRPRSWLDPLQRRHPAGRPRPSTPWSAKTWPSSARRMGVPAPAGSPSISTGHPMRGSPCHGRQWLGVRSTVDRSGKPSCSPPPPARYVQLRPRRSDRLEWHTHLRHQDFVVGYDSRIQLDDSKMTVGGYARGCVRRRPPPPPVPTPAHLRRPVRRRDAGRRAGRVPRRQLGGSLDDGQWWTTGSPQGLRGVPGHPYVGRHPAGVDVHEHGY